MPHQPLKSKDDLKKKIIIHFSEASIVPSISSCSSFHTFHQIKLVLNLQCGKELNECSPPNISDDFCLSLLSVSSMLMLVVVVPVWHKAQRMDLMHKDVCGDRTLYLCGTRPSGWISCMRMLAGIMWNSMYSRKEFSTQSEKEINKTTTQHFLLRLFV